MNLIRFLIGAHLTSEHMHDAGKLSISAYAHGVLHEGGFVQSSFHA